jgi:type IV pilus assembly protein PilY1
MTLSKKLRNLLLAASLLIPTVAIADDIDLFQGGADITGNVPNMLIVLDNAANFSSNAAGAPECIVDGVVFQTPMTGTVGGIEQCAIYTVINGLPDGVVKIGFMVYNGNNIRDYNNNVCGDGSNGGCLAYPLTKVTAANKPAMLNWIRSWKTTGSAGRDYMKASGETTAGSMQEAWAYYKGATGLSGVNYAAIQPTSGCQKNYVIFVGNSYSSAGTPGDGGSASPKAALESAPGITTQLSSIITGTIPTSCGGSYSFPTGSTHESRGHYADEWTRYMHRTDLYSDWDGAQGITTYTIGVLGASCQPEYEALMTTMADELAGGGKYFPTRNTDQLVNAFLKILNEIQDVNSVFTSASLPVSVNTQGTYLNQIYMGVFRPDPQGNPRWLGNLKQYKFGVKINIETKNDEIFLADKNGDAAINGDTGFIRPSAQSYWGTKTEPGFWAFNPLGDGGQYDVPDGNIVEKGGAAQKLRESASARTVKTCLSDCSGGLVSFDASNTALVSTLSGTSASVSLVRTGTTVTGTTSSDLGLTVGDYVTIGSANAAAYNATWEVTGVSNVSGVFKFTFTITETPATPATGSTMLVSSGVAVTQTVPAGGVTYDSNLSSLTYGKALVTLPAHGFANGQTVDISGATGAASDQVYNGSYTIKVVDPNRFYYTPTLGTTTTIVDPVISSTLNETGSPSYRCTDSSGASATYGTAKITRVGTNTVVQLITTKDSTTNTDKCILGNTLELTGVTGYGSSYPIEACPGTFPTGYLAITNKRTFCVTARTSNPTVPPVSPATGTISAAALPSRAITSIIRTAGIGSGNIATVTLTTATPHGFSGSYVKVTGATLTPGAVDGTEYNGTKTTAANNLSFSDPSPAPTGYVAGTTITYTIATGPTATASGTVVKGANVDGATLINWVRGMDNKEDENRNGSFTDVRASVHGDVLHSRPLVIDYGADTFGIVSFYGANDGTLRAVKGGQESTDGIEKWAFVAPEHFSTLSRMYNNSPVVKYPNTNMAILPTPAKRNYYFDGNIGVFQSANRSVTHIFPSMRRGGRFIYALNVSNPNSPSFLWKKTNADLPELGYTWAEPKVIPIKKTAGVACSASDSTTYTRGLIFGAGYDPTQEDLATGTVRNPTMGRGVYVLNAATGALIKLMQPADTKKYSFPADVTLLDTDGDGCVDRVYAVDTGANLFRIDLGLESDADNWKIYKLAALGDVDNNGGTDDRKFMNPPDAVLGFIGGSQVVYVVVGSGNREDPRSTTIEDHFFMIKDTIAVGTDPATVTAVRITDTGMRRIGAYPSDFNAATTTVDPTLSSFKGWYLPLETGEKSVNAPLTIAGTTFFGTNKPKSTSTTSCEPNLGVARGYAINYLNGTSVVGDRDKDGDVDRNDLYTDFTGGGLPPSPVGGLVQIGDKTFRFLIGGGGDDTKGSPIEGTDFTANPSSNRTRVFWYFKKDE